MGKTGWKKAPHGWFEGQRGEFLSKGKGKSKEKEKNIGWHLSQANSLTEAQMQRSDLDGKHSERPWRASAETDDWSWETDDWSWSAGAEASGWSWSTGAEASGWPAGAETSDWQQPTGAEASNWPWYPIVEKAIKWLAEKWEEKEEKTTTGEAGKRKQVESRNGHKTEREGEREKEKQKQTTWRGRAEMDEKIGPGWAGREIVSHRLICYLRYVL